MILLDKKSYDLLSYLIRLEKAETVMTISKTLGQSRRKVYYHLEKINEALPETVSQIVSLPRIGILLTKEQKAACQWLLQDVSDYNYVLKSDERMMLSAIYIAVSTERVTIDKLMQINDVSRNTILNDLNELRMILASKEYSIQLHSTKSSGYYFDCHPLAFIQFLYKLLDDIYHSGNSTFIDFFDHKLSQTLSYTTYFSKDFLQFLSAYLPISQANLGKRINCQDSQFMIQILPYILLSYRNMQFTAEVKDALKKDFNLIWKRKEYYIAKDLAEQLYTHFKLHLDEIEIGLVAMLMLSFRKDKDSHVESPDYDDMRVTLNHFLTALEDRFQLHFSHKKDLIWQLITHCKALIYRKTYGISSVNPLTNHIKDKYEDLFIKTQKCAPILEEAWSMTLSDDDIAYLTIHLGGELRKSSAEPEETKVVIVSDDGIGIQKLLLKQCQQYLLNSQIEAVLTTEQFQSIKDLLKIDFLVTTNSGLDSPFANLVVNPILTDDNILSMIHYSNRGNPSEKGYFSDTLEKTIAQYLDTDTERQILKSRIESLIRQELVQNMIKK
ncbi:transcription antiterminator [Streptococcus didelphis]|uniref:BglG family transcription antiterminator n=1 Tax=Streptococcus didelphis TaxID=102886 RepID=UPI000363B49C|nr:transcription antiterminator [Streptococcus didelphis]WMB29824.1 transcription antiterminator [Streptococcus didelphis]